MLTGAEPDFRWQELGRDVLSVVRRLGVTQWVSLGAIPTAVPHTRPVPVLATASDEGLLHEDEQVGPAGLLRVPSAALSAIEKAVADDGVPTVGFYAQVPHYVGGPYAAAAIAILEHLGRHLGVEPRSTGCPTRRWRSDSGWIRSSRPTTTRGPTSSDWSRSWTTRSCRPATSSWARSSASCSNAATQVPAAR